MIKIPPRLVQVSDLNIAKYSSEDGAFMHQAFIDDFSLLEGVVGTKLFDDLLKKEFGDNAEKVKTIIEEYKMRVGLLEFYLAGLEKNTISREDVTSKRMQDMKTNFAFIELSKKKIINLYVKMMEQTNLINKEIPSSTWKRILSDQKRLQREPLEGQEEIFGEEEQGK